MGGHFHTNAASSPSGRITAPHGYRIAHEAKACAAAVQKTPRTGADWATLRAMTGYVQAHYTEKIRLEQIAAAGAVCRNRCCVLFRKRLGCSPIEYVTRYRLEKACVLLGQGATVTEAALACGFNSASYFTELFRRYYGVTPKNYQQDVETAETGRKTAP